MECCVVCGRSDVQQRMGLTQPQPDHNPNISEILLLKNIRSSAGADGRGRHSVITEFHKSKITKDWNCHGSYAPSSVAAAGHHHDARMSSSR